MPVRCTWKPSLSGAAWAVARRIHGLGREAPSPTAPPAFRRFRLEILAASLVVSLMTILLEGSAPETRSFGPLRPSCSTVSRRVQRPAPGPWPAPLPRGAAHAEGWPVDARRGRRADGLTAAGPVASCTPDALPWIHARGGASGRRSAPA